MGGGGQLGHDHTGERGPIKHQLDEVVDYGYFEIKSLCYMFLTQNLPNVSVFFATGFNKQYFTVKLKLKLIRKSRIFIFHNSHNLPVIYCILFLLQNKDKECSVVCRNVRDFFFF